MDVEDVEDESMLVAMAIGSRRAGRGADDSGDAGRGVGTVEGDEESVLVGG